MLGAVWSLLNPIVFVAVFSFVVVVLDNNIDWYPFLLLSGLLAWNLFSVSLSSGAQSVIANANLVKKVYFPREVLPLSTVGVALFDFFIQSAVFFAFMMAFRFGFVLANIWLYPIAFIALVLFTTAVCMWVSALNVRYRDVQHLLGLALLVWFWMTPIVYSAHPVQTKLSEHTVAGVSLWHVFLANPVAWIVFGFQRALYHAPREDEVLAGMSTGQLAAGLGVVIAVSAALCYLTWRAFFSFSGDFAEEL